MPGRLPRDIQHQGLGGEHVQRLRDGADAHAKLVDNGDVGHKLKHAINLTHDRKLGDF